MKKIFYIIASNIKYYRRIFKYLIATIKEYVVKNDKMVTKVSFSLMTGVAVLSLSLIIGKVFLAKDNMNYDDREVYAFEYSTDESKEDKNVIDETQINETAPKKVVPTPTVEETEEESKNTVIKAKKATVNDKEDPQKNKKGGASIDIAKITIKEPNKDVSSVESKEYLNDSVTYGIDVSKWQGKIDWKKVKASGVEFAMIRVGYRSLSGGTLYEDPYAKYNLQQAQANGIKVGVYFFSTAINKKEVLEEARWVTQFIAPYSITYPVAYDCEEYNNRNYRHYSLSKNERTDLAIVFLDHVKSKGYSPIFYNSSSHLRNNSQWNTSKLNEKCEVWVAQWVDNFTPSSRSEYNGPHDMWQYTARGKVSGIKGYVDLNVAYFGYSKGKTQDPTSTPIPTETEIETETKPTTATMTPTPTPVSTVTVTPTQVSTEAPNSTDISVTLVPSASPRPTGDEEVAEAIDSPELQ